MKAIRVFAVAAITIMAVISIGATRSAWASPPYVESGHDTRSFIAPYWSRVCGFPVTRTYDIYWTDRYISQENGVEREIFMQHGTETFSTAGGGSITGRIQGPAVFITNPDQSGSFFQAGQMQRFLVPGFGLIYGETGSYYQEWDADGNIITERESGPLVDNEQAICDAIEP